MGRISSELLLELYGAAQEPGRWTGFLDRICKDLGVANAAVQCFDVRGGRLGEVWCVRDTRSMAMSEVHDRLVNNSANPRLDLSIGQISLDQQIERDTDRFARDCPHYSALRARLKAAGLGESMSLNLPVQANRVHSLVLHHGSDSSRSFGHSDDAYLLELSAHLDQALKLNSRFDAQSEDLLALRRVLDDLRVGIIISRDGRSVDWANVAAEDLMRRSPFLVNLGSRGGVSRFRTGARTPETTVLAAGEECELQVFAMQLDRGEADRECSASQGIALLLVEPRRAPELAPDELARVLGITRGEGRIAAWLAGGGTLKDFASHRGISEGSVRNQAKLALSKTGVPRQADLVRHICSSIPGLLRGPISQLGE